MTRSKLLASVALLALLAAAAMPAGAVAHGYSYCNETGDDALGWAIFSGDDANMSDLKDVDSMDESTRPRALNGRVAGLNARSPCGGGFPAGRSAASTLGRLTFDGHSSNF